jgi:hypothetical protein
MKMNNLTNALRLNEYSVFKVNNFVVANVFSIDRWYKNNFVVANVFSIDRWYKPIIPSTMEWALAGS